MKNYILYSTQTYNVVLFNIKITSNIRRFTFLLLLLFSNFHFSQIRTSVPPFTTSGEWTVPCGVTAITVEAWGGGGGGGGTQTKPFGGIRGGGGGGGGGYIRSNIVVTTGSKYQIIVGAGGEGIKGNSGGSGKSSKVQTMSAAVLVSAAGGQGGIYGNNNNDSDRFGAGGLGGFGGSAPGGTILQMYKGGDGSRGNTDNNSGSGGGGAGNGGPGGNGATLEVESGLGGISDSEGLEPTVGGLGGWGIKPGLFEDGNNGGLPGGGASGAAHPRFLSLTGGNGGRGLVKISYTRSVTIAPNTSNTICNGTAVTFTATPINTGASTYQWKLNGVNISGATGITYTKSNLANNDEVSVVVTSCAGEVITSNVVKINVTPLNTAGTASSSPTLCIKTALTAITHTTTGATGIGAAIGLPAGVTATWANNTITISGTPTAFGTFNYSIPLTGGCGTASATGTIKVTAERTVSAASSSPKTCINTLIKGDGIIHNTTGVTAILSADGLPNGVTAIYTSGKPGTSGVITISGAPKESGIFNYIITPDGCGTATATGTITVLAERTVSAASSSPKTCINTPIKGDGIIHNTTGVTAILSVDGLPDGVTATYTSGKPGTSGVITISGAPKESGIFNYIITPDGCGSATAIGTITVTANMTVSLPSSSPILCSNTALTPITHVTTDATGIHDSGVSGANGLPAGVSATWLGNIITISGTPTEIGTFNYSIPLVGCGKVNATGTIKTDALTTYIGSGNWSNGIPDISKRAIFPQNYSTLENEALIACSCEVTSGATLTIIPKSSVTIQNDISNNGNIIVESDGNLIQNNDNGTYTGNGLFKVLRDSRMKRLDYTYWSAPVTGQNFYKFSPATVSTRFLEYYENEDWFYPVNWSTNFQIAKGYAIRAPNNFPATLSESNPLNLFKGIFVGNPNNGSISFSLKYSVNGYNLVGNPYPSNIDFDELHNLNSAEINHLAYFWTNSNLNPVQQSSAYNGDNYAMYTGTGGKPALNGKLTPNEFIKVGQGFIIKAKETANEKPLVFNNFIRSDDKSSNFFSKGNTAAKDRYWLTLTSPALNVNTILIGYIRQATNDFELDYDAPLMTIGSDSFFSILNESKLGIQGRQYPLSVSDVVPLGSNHYETGDYILSLGDRQGVFASTQNIYLKDKQTGTVTNLSEKAYVFRSNKGLIEGRFEIRYQPEIVLATDTSSKENLVIYRDGNEFVLKSSTINITRIEVYDASGRLMIKSQPNQKDVRIDAGTFANGVYILKINQEGTVISKKVIK